MNLIWAIALVLFATAASAQTTENLGSFTAVQGANSLGFNTSSNAGSMSTWEYQKVALAGGKHVRFQCSWATTTGSGGIEGQSAPPSNTSTGFTMTPQCAQSLADSKANGLTPTVLVFPGPPFHQTLTVQLTAAATAGATSLAIQFVSAVGGVNMSNIQNDHKHFISISGNGNNSNGRTYAGDMVMSACTTSTTCTIQLASALTSGWSNGQQLVINEMLYSPALSASPTDPWVVRYTALVAFVANYMNAQGIVGEIELWNEPPWPDDCSDNLVDCYDSDPGFTNEQQRNSSNFGIAAAIQASTAVSGITYSWGGTEKSSSGDMLSGNMFAASGVQPAQPSVLIQNQSFHPYGRAPEDKLSMYPCLQALPSGGYSACNFVVGGSLSGSNFGQVMLNNVVAKNSNAAYGIPEEMTEDGFTTASGDELHKARFAVRDLLTANSDHIFPLEFYRFFEGGASGSSGYGFMIYPGSVPTPLPAYTAVSGLIADINTIAHASPTSIVLPTVTSTSGLTYPLDYLTITGARAGDTANSYIMAVWQRSNTSGNWGALAQPTPGPVTVAMPAGVSLLSAVNASTRAAVTPTVSGQNVSMSVSDDPIELMMVPSVAVASLTPTALTFTATSGTAPASQNLTLSNTGTANLAISSIVISGANPSAFTQTNNCGANLSAGSTCLIAVSFVPTTGTFSASLVVTDNASNGATQTSTLSGTSTSAAGITVGNTSFTQLSVFSGGVTVAYTSTVPIYPGLQIISPRVTGTGMVQYTTLSTAGSVTFPGTGGLALIPNTTYKATFFGRTADNRYIYQPITFTTPASYTPSTMQPQP